jgi:hypothetical protein
MIIEWNNILYYFQGTGSKGASVFTDLHEEAYAKVDQVFDAKLPRKLRMFVWTDPQLAAQKLGYPLGFAVSKECVCFVRVNQTLGHEMTHILSYWAWGIPPKSYSKFVNEGLAVAFDLSETDKIARAKTALADYNVQSVSQFWSGSFEAAPDDLFYAVAGAFIEFLFRKNMPDQFNALVKNQTLESAQDIYGVERLDALMKEFDGLVGL